MGSIKTFTIVVVVVGGGGGVDSGGGDGHPDTSGKARNKSANFTSFMTSVQKEVCIFKCISQTGVVSCLKAVQQ